MARGILFYDLKHLVYGSITRIMQFAGQRTNLDLEPIGDPVNLLIKLTPDVLPGAGCHFTHRHNAAANPAGRPDEAEFLQKNFMAKWCSPAPFLSGFNSIRFDDEFMRPSLPPTSTIRMSSVAKRLFALGPIRPGTHDAVSVQTA